MGKPQLQSDKTECPPDIEPEIAASTLAVEIETGIAAGRCSVLRESAWPRYVWGRTFFSTVTGEGLEVVWEARLVNQEQGSYKAYPVTEERHSNLMPLEVQELLWP
jgi:hypothetical protein